MRSDTWLEQLAHELGGRGLDAQRVAAVVVETEGHLRESGEPALAVFGPPSEYAVTVLEALAAERARTEAGPERVSLRGVDKRRGQRQVLSAVDLTVRDGQALLLMGPNGAGKSTLLEILAGLLSPDRGSVAIEGTVGYAPQNGGLVDHLLASEHFVLFGAPRGLPREVAVREGSRIAEQLGWDPLLAPVAGELSGGTRQKLSISLAMLGQPDVLLLDEPYQGLDLESVQRFWDLLWSWRDAGRCALVASHAADAIERADVVVELGRTEPVPPA